MASQQLQEQLQSEGPYTFVRRDSSQMRNDAHCSQTQCQHPQFDDPAQNRVMYAHGAASSTLSSAPSMDSHNGAWNQHPYDDRAPLETEVFSFARKPPEAATSTNNSVTTAWSGVIPLEVETPQPLHRTNNNNDNKLKRRKEKAKQTMQQVGSTLWKNLNVAKWIDDLEHDQDLADYLEHVNIENEAELERQEICRQALQACLEDIRQHLLEYIQVHPHASYEEWIAELHPDNVTTSLQGLTSAPMIDHRFYVANSDHRILWNEHLGDQTDTSTNTPIRTYVPARGALRQSSPPPKMENHDNSNDSYTLQLTGEEEGETKVSTPVLLDLSDNGNVAASSTDASSGALVDLLS